MALLRSDSIRGAALGELATRPGKNSGKEKNSEDGEGEVRHLVFRGVAGMYWSLLFKVDLNEICGNIEWILGWINKRWLCNGVQVASCCCSWCLMTMMPREGSGSCCRCWIVHELWVYLRRLLIWEDGTFLDRWENLLVIGLWSACFDDDPETIQLQIWLCWAVFQNRNKVWAAKMARKDGSVMVKLMSAGFNLAADPVRVGR